MAGTFIRHVNGRGIPALETVSAELTASAETFSFNPHPAADALFQGLLAVRVSGTPDAPADAVPVLFATRGAGGPAVAVCDAAGTAVTTATWPGDGVFLFFFDRTTNVLRLLTGIV